VAYHLGHDPEWDTPTTSASVLRALASIRSMNTASPWSFHGQRTRGSLPDVCIGNRPRRGRLPGRSGSCNKEADSWAPFSPSRHVLLHSASPIGHHHTRNRGMSVEPKAASATSQLAELAVEGKSHRDLQAPGLRLARLIKNWL